MRERLSPRCAVEDADIAAALNMSSDVLLLIEPDDARARDVCQALARSSVERRVVRLRSVEEADPAALERAALVLLGDDLVATDLTSALLGVIERRPDAAVVVLLREATPGLAEEAIASGALDVAFIPPDFDGMILALHVEKSLAITRLRRNGMRSQAALASAVAHLKRRNRDLEKALSRFEVLASTDPLTGLANRWRLQEQATALFAEAIRHGFDLTCMMIDLDNFKSVNDGLGHHRGDELLTIAGRLVNAQIRLSDLAARYGGDEFVILLPHTSAEDAAILAHRLQRAFRKQVEDSLREDGFNCAMSAGVASLRDVEPESVDALIAAADDALYAAKARFGPCVVIAGPEQRRSPGVAAGQPLTE